MTNDLTPRSTFTPADLEAVENLAGKGLGIKVIASALGVSFEHFRQQRHKDVALETAYQKGKAKLYQDLVSKLVEKALAGNVACLIFACKALIGVNEAGPEDRGPAVAVQINLPAAMSDEQYGRLVQMTTRSLSDGAEGEDDV